MIDTSRMVYNYSPFASKEVGRKNSKIRASVTRNKCKETKEQTTGSVLLYIGKNNIHQVMNSIKSL